MTARILKYYPYYNTLPRMKRSVNLVKKIINILIICSISILCSSCAENTQKNIFPTTIYEDDICKIVAEDFTDSSEPGYTYYLPLTFENKSSEAFIVAAGYGTMNGEKVFIVCIPESGEAEYDYEFVVMPNETITEIFRVNYAQTSIRNINKVKTIEANFTLYKINSHEEILNTGSVSIDVK